MKGNLASVSRKVRRDDQGVGRIQSNADDIEVNQRKSSGLPLHIH